MRIKIPHIVYIIGLVLGGLIFGYMADHSGRKMVLLGKTEIDIYILLFILLLFKRINVGCMDFIHISTTE